MFRYDILISPMQTEKRDGRTIHFFEVLQSDGSMSRPNGGSTALHLMEETRSNYKDIAHPANMEDWERKKSWYRREVIPKLRYSFIDMLNFNHREMLKSIENNFPEVE